METQKNEYSGRHKVLWSQCVTKKRVRLSLEDTGEMFWAVRKPRFTCLQAVVGKVVCFFFLCGTLRPRGKRGVGCGLPFLLLSLSLWVAFASAGKTPEGAGSTANLDRRNMVRAPVPYEHEHEAARFNAVLTNLTTRLKADPRSSLRSRREERQHVKNGLVVVNAIGRRELLPMIAHNINSHFKEAVVGNNVFRWHCIAFTYVTEDDIPADDPALITIAGLCEVMRFPGTNWGTFLRFLSPPLVGMYDHIMLLLDDMFLPSGGPHAVNIPDMLHSMYKHDLTTIQPDIQGHGGWSQVNNKPEAWNNSCLAKVDGPIELFAQVFSAAGWQCFSRMLHHSNSVGWCLDTCYPLKCPGIAQSIDYRMQAYHIARAHVPEHAHPDKTREEVGLPPHGLTARRVSTKGSKVLCETLKCPRPRAQRVPTKTQLECS